jgi:hypothetical protein
MPGRQPDRTLFKIVIEIKIPLGNKAVIFRRYLFEQVIKDY